MNEIIWRVTLNGGERYVGDDEGFATGEVMDLSDLKDEQDVLRISAEKNGVEFYFCDSHEFSE